jgi:hypothetical protein
MNSIDQQGKPTCLILDEVDGALGGAEGDQSRGLQMVADFITKCIKQALKQPHPAKQVD